MRGMRNLIIRVLFWPCKFNDVVQVAEYSDRIAFRPYWDRTVANNVPK